MKIIAGILMVAVVVLWSCTVEGDLYNDQVYSILPTVTTNSVTYITTNSATCGGNVTSAGKADVTDRGVCWSTSLNPTVNDSKTTNRRGTGNFTSTLTGLTANQTYYVRAYATSTKGTAYGNQVSFKTENIYILDDGIAEEGWYALSTNIENLWMGNQFMVGESGELTSIDIYGLDDIDNKDNQVYIDIYNHSRALVGSSASFVIPENAWVNVPVTGISYSGTFYVMIRWPAGSFTNALGIDTNGPKAKADLNWVRRVNGNWTLLHNDHPNEPTARGVFLIRAKAKTSSSKSVMYEAGPQTEETGAPMENASAKTECSNSSSVRASRAIGKLK